MALNILALLIRVSVNQLQFDLYVVLVLAGMVNFSGSLMHNFIKKVNFLIQVIKQWAGPAEMSGQARNLNTDTNTHMHTQIHMYIYIIFLKKMEGRHEKYK